MSRRPSIKSGVPPHSAAFALGLAAGLGFAAARLRRSAVLERQPNRHTGLPQLLGAPRRRYYRGRDLQRAVAIADLRAITHRRLPRFALEYLEGGAEDEATLWRERTAFAEWRFAPRTLVDVSARSLASPVLGREAPLPLVVAPTGLNGVFGGRADLELARGAAAAGVPFVQSTMSNMTMEEVAQKAPGVRHWWQLYVFGPDEVWQELVRRAEAVGCEALVLTTNAQIFGNREWERRNLATPSRLTVDAALESLEHPRWFASTLLPKGPPGFPNVVDFVPKDRRGLFACAHWIREHQPTSLSWETVGKIRERWRGPLVLKGLLNLEDVRLAREAGADVVVLSSHGGRQLDWAISPLDVLPQAREVAGDRLEVHLSGGIRRGTDMLKALALGADAVWTGRATLYGLCAGRAAGVARAVRILQREAVDAMGLCGACRPSELRDLLVRSAPAGQGATRAP